VNTVTPGPIETPGLKELAPQGQEQGLLDQLKADVPLGRLGKPDEIASAVLYLASDLSSFVTGTELFVDGGAEQL
jgi:NAD(P)-dependent dehydrogenase (short-subunit alcohol dehydrogenase family)